MDKNLKLQLIIEAQTQNAKRELQALGSVIKPISVPVSFDAAAPNFKIGVDPSGAGQKIGAVAREEISKARVQLDPRSRVDLATSIEKSIFKAIRESIPQTGSGVFGGLAGLLLAPLKIGFAALGSIAEGAFIGIGASLAAELGKGIEEAIISSSTQTITAEQIGRKLAESILDGYKSQIAGETTGLIGFLNNLAKDLRAEFVDAIGLEEATVANFSRRKQGSDRREQQRRDAFEQASAQRQQTIRDLPATRARFQKLASEDERLAQGLANISRQYVELQQKAAQGLSPQEASDFLNQQRERLRELETIRDAYSQLRVYGTDLSEDQRAGLQRLVQGQNIPAVLEERRSLQERGISLLDEAQTPDQISQSEINRAVNAIYSPQFHALNQQIEQLTEQRRKIQVELNKTQAVFDRGAVEKQLINSLAPGQGTLPEFRRLVDAVAQISGVSVDPRQLPQLAVSRSIDGVGAYRPESNQVIVPPETLQRLVDGSISDEEIRTLAHEIRHAIQSGFGDAYRVAASLQGSIDSPVPLLSPTEAERRIVGDGIEQSVAAAAARNPRRAAASRQIEADAYTFEQRYGNEVISRFRASSAPLDQAAAQSAEAINQMRLELARLTQELEEARRIGSALDKDASAEIAQAEAFLQKARSLADTSERRVADAAGTDLQSRQAIAQSLFGVSEQISEKGNQRNRAVFERFSEPLPPPPPPPPPPGALAVVESSQGLQHQFDRAANALAPITNRLAPAYDAAKTALVVLGKTTYAAADALEFAAFSMIPGGAIARKPVKALIRNAAIPAATFAAASTIPGFGAVAGLATSGVGHLVSPFVGAATGAIGGQIASGVGAGQAFLTNAIASSGVPGAGVAANALGQVLTPMAQGVVATANSVLSAVGTAATSGIAEVTTAIAGGKLIQHGLQQGGAKAVAVLPGTAQSTVLALGEASQPVVNFLGTQVQEVAEKIPVNLPDREQVKEFAFEAGVQTRKAVDAAVEIYESVADAGRQVKESFDLITAKLPDGLKLGDLSREQLKQVLGQLEQKLKAAVGAEAKGQTVLGGSAAIRRDLDSVRRTIEIKAEEVIEQTINEVTKETETASDKFQRLVSDNIEIRDAIRDRYQDFQRALKSGDEALVRAQAESLREQVRQARDRVLSSTQELQSEGGDTSQATKLGRILDGLKQSYTKILNGLDQGLSKVERQQAKAADELGAEIEQARFGDSIEGLSAAYDRLVQSVSAGVDELTELLNRAIAVGFDVEKGTLGQTARAAATSSRAQDLAVNTVGAIASGAASQYGLEAQLAADLLGALTARQSLAVGGATAEAGQELLQEEAFQSANALEKFSMLVDRASEKLRQRQFEIGNDLTGDVSGFAIGNAAALASSPLKDILDTVIPGAGAIPVGAIAASLGVPKIQDIRNKFTPGAELEPELEEAKFGFERVGDEVQLFYLALLQRLGKLPDAPQAELSTALDDAIAFAENIQSDIEKASEKYRAAEQRINESVDLPTEIQRLPDVGLSDAEKAQLSRLESGTIEISPELEQQLLRPEIELSPEAEATLKRLESGTVEISPELEQQLLRPEIELSPDAEATLKRLDSGIVEISPELEQQLLRPEIELSPDAEATLKRLESGTVEFSPELERLAAGEVKLSPEASRKLRELETGNPTEFSAESLSNYLQEISDDAAREDLGDRLLEIYNEGADERLSLDDRLVEITRQRIDQENQRVEALVSNLEAQRLQGEEDRGHRLQIPFQVIRPPQPTYSVDSLADHLEEISNNASRQDLGDRLLALRSDAALSDPDLGDRLAQLSQEANQQQKDLGDRLIQLAEEGASEREDLSDRLNRLSQEGVITVQQETEQDRIPANELIPTPSASPAVAEVEQLVDDLEQLKNSLSDLGSLELGEIPFPSTQLEQDFNELKASISRFSQVNSESISDYSEQIASLQSESERLYNELIQSGGDVNASTLEPIFELQRQIKNLQQIAEETAQANREVEDLDQYLSTPLDHRRVQPNRGFETPNQRGIYQDNLEQLRREREQQLSQPVPQSQVGNVEDAVVDAEKAFASFVKNADKYDAAANRVGEAVSRDFGKAEKALESFADSAKKGLGQLIGHRNVDRLSESLGDLATQGRPAEAFFDRLGKTSQTAAGGLKFLLENAGNLIKGFIGFYVLDQAGEQLFRFGKAAFDTTQQLNRYRNTLGFVLGDQARGSKEFEFARQEAERLSIPLNVSAEGYTQIVGALKGTRQEGGKAREIFSGLAQTIKAYNLTQEQSASLTTQVGQAFRKQRLQTEEAIIIAESGIPIYQLLQESLGIGAGELADRFQAGAVSADDLGNALLRLKETTATATGDAAINSINSFGNQFTQLKDQIGQAISPAVARFFTLLGEAIAFLKETLSGLAPFFSLLGEAINVVLSPAKLLIDVFGFYLGIIGKIIPPTVALRAILVALGAAITIALIPATLAWSTALLALAVNTIPALIGVVSAFVLANPALVAAIGAIAIAAAVAKPAIDGLADALDGVKLEANEAAISFNSDYQDALNRLQKGIPLTKAEMDKLKQGFEDNVKAGKDSEATAKTLTQNLEKLQSRAENAAKAQKALNEEIESSTKAFEGQSSEIESSLLDRQVAISEAEAKAAERGNLDADRYNAERLKAEQRSTSDLVDLYKNRAQAIQSQISRIQRLGTFGLSDTEIQQQKETLEKLETELIEIEQKGKQARIQVAQKTTAEITRVRSQEAALALATSEKSLEDLKKTGAKAAEEIKTAYDSEGREISRWQTRRQADVQKSLNAQVIHSAEAAAQLAEIDTHRINAEIKRERLKLDILAKLPKTQDKGLLAQRAEETAAANDRIDQLQLERLNADAAFVKAQDNILAVDLGMLEKELSQANQSIDQAQAERLIDEERLASQLSLNEQQRSDRALAIERERLADQYVINQSYVEELRKLPQPNDPEAQEALQEKIRDGLKQTSSLTLELLRNEAQQNDLLKQRIQERLNTQIELAEKANSAELELLGAFERTLQRQQTLAQRSFDLSQSRLNLAQTELDIQIEQEKDEGKRNRLIEKRTELQREGLLEQQRLARENLEVELQQAELAARRQKFESEITALKARQSQIQAEIELQDALKSGDAERIDNARTLLALTKAQVESAKLLTQEAENSLGDERDRAVTAKEALLNNQEAERLRFQFDANKAINDPGRKVEDFGASNDNFNAKVPESISQARSSITDLLKGVEPIRLFAGDRADQSIAAQLGDKLLPPLQTVATYQQKVAEQSTQLVVLSKQLLSQLQLANGGLNTIADRKPVTVVQASRSLGSGLGQLTGLNI